MSNEAMKAELPKGNFEVSSELSEKSICSIAACLPKASTKQL
jgi:hypothetical protein